MTPSSHTARSLSRRALSAAAIVFCLSMAGSNLIGAFADTPQAPVVATISADMTSSLNSGTTTVIATLQSINDKATVISQVNTVLPGSVHDDFSALPILAINSVHATDIDALSRIPGIIALEPNREMTPLGAISPATSSSTTTADYLDWIHGTNVTGSGSAALTGTGRVIGIIDAGIDVNHPEFQGPNGTRVVSQACFQDSAEVAPCPAAGSANPANVAQTCAAADAGCWHGNAVASFAAGNFAPLKDQTTGFSNNLQGVAPGASISYIRIAEDKAGDDISSTNVIAAINKFTADAQAHSAIAPDVVNMSFGFAQTTSLTCDQVPSFHAVFTTLVNAGVTVVASAGDDGNKTSISIPSCFNDVIGVGATKFTRDAQNNITGETVADYSPDSPDLDIVAPGTALPIATPDPNEFLTGYGTSFSAPLVSGAVALLRQVNPQLTPAQIQTLLVNNADPVTDPVNGNSYPRLDIAKAVTAAQGSTTTTTTTTPITTTTTPGAPTTTTPGTPTTTAPGTPTTTTPFTPVTTVVTTPVTVPITTPATVPVTVLGTNVTNTSAATSTTAATSLPFTGSSSTQLFFSAMWILLAGVALLCYKEGFARLALRRRVHQ